MLLHVFIKHVKPNNIKDLFWIFSLYDSFSLARLGKLHSLPYRFYRLYSLPQGPSTCSNLWSFILEIFKEFALPAPGGCSMDVFSRE